MSHNALVPNVTIGLDLGDRMSRTYEVDAGGARLREGTVPTTVAGITDYFANRERCRVVVEVGTHSPWVSRLLDELGHETIVANPSAMFAGRGRRRRNDRLDAQFLARQGRADVTLVSPIQHRSADAQRDLELLRARDQLVAVRTKLINHVRGAVKSSGGGGCRGGAASFWERAAGGLAQGRGAGV
jgi:transposase